MEIPFKEELPQRNDCRGMNVLPRNWPTQGVLFAHHFFFITQSPIPETNSSHLKIGKLVFQPSIYRGELLVSRRVDERK